MTLVDLLSDTAYRQQAKKRLDELLDNGDKFPVKATQIYGLRQIARQQPREVKEFAKHQRERTQLEAEIKFWTLVEDLCGDRDKLKKSQKEWLERTQLEAEIKFWTLVEDLCGDSTSDWSVLKVAHLRLPVELRDENIPRNQECKTHADRRRRNKLKKSQKEWLEQWENEHIPAFFERFCTHSLYRLGLAEKS